MRRDPPPLFGSSLFFQIQSSSSSSPLLFSSLSGSRLDRRVVTTDEHATWTRSNFFFSFPSFPFSPLVRDSWRTKRLFAEQNVPSSAITFPRVAGPSNQIGRFRMTHALPPRGVNIFVLVGVIQPPHTLSKLPSTDRTWPVWSRFFDRLFSNRAACSTSSSSSTVSSPPAFRFSPPPPPSLSANLKSRAREAPGP